MLAADKLTPPCSEPQTPLRALLNLPLIAEPKVGIMDVALRRLSFGAERAKERAALKGLW